MKVILITNHTHKGVSYKPGDEIDMTPEDAAWYRDAIMEERFEQDRLANTALGLAVKKSAFGDPPPDPAS